ncbi:signal peptide peptidase SppA [Chitinispirillales bacterium ANBcel5]|uniref:signal peptide peptidase SppA n=1 Tax=Cellulosispirillum alkaliphilum TaxID=3039283 RepID=UPI002A4FE56D|nr:signal peptide peptidase SppA [Chitinispirillales bacterium ANBcel5]
MHVLTKVLAVIGAVTLITVIIFIVFGIYTRHTRDRIYPETVLEIDFGLGLVESPPPSPVNRLIRGERLRIREIVEALDTGAQDNRVRAVIARIDGGPFRYGDVQEIRDAVKRFRTSGKRAIAYAETFGEFGPGNSLYYLASSFDAIYLQPSGELGLTGLLSQSPFIEQTLEKLDVQAQITGREEYKTAQYLYTERGFTDEQREVAESITDSILSVMVRDIAADRDFDEQTLRNLIKEGPFGAQQALEHNFVDELGYRDAAFTRIREEAGENVRFLFAQKYINRLPQNRRGEAIALIYADGAIVRGKSRSNPFTGERLLGAKTVAAAIRAAVRDNDVGAIVLRINSPGGSYVASDKIWRETVQARKAGKPVIASMGAVAGSGGYFIAMDAEKIVAHPSTITGSIGVVGGKVVTRGFFNKLGITFDDVRTSENAVLWSPLHPYTEQNWEYVNSWLDRVYDDFVTKVAEGRNMEREKVEQVARGRVYTGTEALHNGLIDTLGGFPAAFNIAKSVMGIPVDKPVRVKIFPEPQTLLEQLTGRTPESSEQRGTELELLESGNVTDLIKEGVLGKGDLRGILYMNEPIVY